MINGKCASCGRELKNVSADVTLLNCPFCRATFTPSLPDAAAGLGEFSAVDEDRGVLLPPDFKSRYRLGHQIGAGASGSVYLAKDLQTNQRVAVKIMAAFGSPTVLSRYLAEGRLLTQSQHINVVRLIEASTYQGQAYLVSEYMPGGSLRAVLDRQGRLATGQALTIMLDVLSGLQACHSRGVVHRDLKPENILLSLTGQAKLSDFGIAKSYSDIQPALTATGMLMGTPRYMAPELARGESAVVASDLYAVGVVLYELLAGVPPFEAKSLFELFQMHNFQDPPSLVGLVDDVSDRLWTVIARCLAKNPKSRPQSADDVAISLGHVLRELKKTGRVSTEVFSGRMPVPRTPVVLPRAPRPIVGRVVAWSAGLLVAALVTCGLWPLEHAAAKVLRPPTARPPRAKPVLRLQSPAWCPLQATGAPDTPEAGDYRTAWASQDPDGGLEWLELDYVPSIRAQTLRIRETFNPGAIVGIELKAADGRRLAQLPIAENPRPAPAELAVALPLLPPIGRVRILLDTRKVLGWNEIDAVELVGDGVRAWAVNARASSYYAQLAAMTMPSMLRKGWSAHQALGAPDTPVAGDFTTAWASRDPDGGPEWLELSYRLPIAARLVRVCESFNPGAVIALQLLDEQHRVLARIPVFASPRPAPAWLEIPVPRDLPPVRRVKLELDTRKVLGWNEIDAVELVGDGQRAWASEASASSSYGDL